MHGISRRTFIGTIGAALAAPAFLRAQSRARRLPIAFSTLGCPAWDWKTVLRQADALGYAAIELRGLQGEMDLTRRPEFTSDLKTSLKDLAALSLKVSDLGASTRLHEDEPARRRAALDEAKRFIDLAARLGAPYVRVFGDKVPPGQSREAVIERIIAGMRELGAHARGSQVAVIIESHGDFADSPSLHRILSASEMPTTGLLWDAHHTFVLAREEPGLTFKQLGRYVRHTHLKDSRPAENGRRYVLTGTGEVPVRETVRVLVAGGYRGYYCFEWEKAWHPEIEEPEVAFPHYARVMREYLAAAGVTV
jgi:sugar phosphate isomerase/epimerase